MLSACIEFHHNINAAKQYPREVALVHVANVLALLAEIHSADLNDVSPIDAEAWARLGLAADDQAELIESVIAEAADEIVEAEKLMFGQ